MLIRIFLITAGTKRSLNLLSSGLSSNHSKTMVAYLFVCFFINDYDFILLLLLLICILFCSLYFVYYCTATSRMNNLLIVLQRNIVDVLCRYYYKHYHGAQII